MSYIFPIGGGKGGIGKTFIASNIGAIFAKQGKSVVLVDLDLGGSNLHTFFGIKGVNAGLHSFLNKSQTELSRVVESTRIPNLSIISSMNCSIEIPNLFHAQKLKIIRAIQNLPFDIVILDLGAGTNSNILDFFHAFSLGQPFSSTLSGMPGLKQSQRLPFLIVYGQSRFIGLPDFKWRRLDRDV